jgi:pyruvate/2-oxoglutarate dehydrogenase complex dihydrolipoamide acyltransferase (E2) component
MFGISEFSAVINPPQIGILAVGKSQLKFDANMNVQTIVTFTLSYDERCCNLDRASKFMNTLNCLIANPQLLVDNSSPL